MAWLPSIPFTPTPTLAALIILTSFAPSPTARVLPHYLTILVRVYLSLGETLQQITLEDILNNFDNLRSVSSFILRRISPETIVTFSLLIRWSIDYTLFINISACYGSQSSVIFYERSSINPQEYPIETAVYFLSPVNIQIFIDDFLRSSMVFLTSFWSLSSMAVAPSNLNPLSILDCN